MQPLTTSSSAARDPSYRAQTQGEDRQANPHQSSTIEGVDRPPPRASWAPSNAHPCRNGRWLLPILVTFPSPVSRTSLAIGSPTFRLFLLQPHLRLSARSCPSAGAGDRSGTRPALYLDRAYYDPVRSLPVAAIIDKLLPRWMSRRFIDWVYTRVGAKGKADQLKEKYKVEERWGLRRSRSRSAVCECRD